MCIPLSCFWFLMQGEIDSLRSLVFVQSKVSDALRNEVNRLQQFTRRPCISISGIDKTRGESKDDLQKSIQGILDEVDCDVTLHDVDKFHRDGPTYDGFKQDIIVRFKSHAAKESVYRARKSTTGRVRIRPSLTKSNKILLDEARNVLKNYNVDNSNMKNPPVAVFPNIHGEIQVKFTEDTKKGMFIGFNSIEQLAHILSCAESESVHELDVWNFSESETDSDSGSD